MLLVLPHPVGAGLGMVVLLVFAVLLSRRGGNCSLIASSQVQMCMRSSIASEPMFAGGKKCKKKFFVTLTVRSGQVRSMGNTIMYLCVQCRCNSVAIALTYLRATSTFFAIIQ